MTLSATETPITLSIVIPVYKTRDTLRRCVESLDPACAPDDVEIILIDDGCPQGSGVVCDALAQEYSAVRTLHRENGGLAAARNTGMQHARGQFVTFLDSDDYVESAYIPQTLNAIRQAQQDGAELVIFSHYMETERGMICRRVDPAVSAAQGLRRMVAAQQNNTAWNKIFSLDIIREHALSFPEELRVAEDIGFLAQYAIYVHNVLPVDVPLYYYLRNPNGITGSVKPAALQYTVQAHRYVERFCSACAPALLGQAEEATIERLYHIVYKLFAGGVCIRDVQDALRGIRSSLSAMRRSRDPKTRVKRFLMLHGMVRLIGRSIR